MSAIEWAEATGNQAGRDQPVLKLVDPYDEPLPIEQRPLMAVPGYNRAVSQRTRAAATPSKSLPETRSS